MYERARSDKVASEELGLGLTIYSRGLLEFISIFAI